MFFRLQVLWWKRIYEHKARDPVHTKLFLLERGNKLKWRGKMGRGDIIKDTFRRVKRNELMSQ